MNGFRMESGAVFGENIGESVFGGENAGKNNASGKNAAENAASFNAPTFWKEFKHFGGKEAIKNLKKALENLGQNDIKKAEFLELVPERLRAKYSLDSTISNLNFCGANLAENKDFFSLKTKNLALQNAEFCFVDIETSGSKAEQSNLLEIGALKWRDGEVLGRFESFVYARSVPRIITRLTGIRARDLKNAPLAAEVLAAFRNFLGDAIFVAHNVNFDYNFLDFHFQKNGLGGLLNPKLCTIDLARKTILSRRYALSFLNEFLGINNAVSHRAYADALTSFRVFEVAKMCLPFGVKNASDLLIFSKLGRVKFRQFLEAKNG